jgi:hypothetical protein
MRIRSGGDLFHSAGIWFNKTDNSGLAGFVGMEDDTHAGIWGAGAFRLSVNTTNGALKINGNEGTSGQVLTSNGSGQAPVWQSPTGSLYNNAVSFYQTTNLHLNCNSCFGDMIPTTATSLVITKQSKVLFSFSGFVDPLGISDTRTEIGFSVIRVSDGLPVATDWYKMVAIVNGGSSFSKTTGLIALAPDNYVLALGATQVNGSTNQGTNFGNGVITAIVIEQ